MNNINGFKTLLYKEVSRVFRIWKQTILPPVITISLYFLVFGKFLGGKIQDINGYGYIDFIVPGLVMMSVITAAYSNTVSSFYGARFQNSIQELLVSPMPKWQILIGYVLGGVVRGFIVGIVVLIVSLLFTSLNIHSITYSLLFMFFTSSLFSLAGFLNGIFANSFDDVSLVPTFIITPLTYLGGVFYSVSLLPGIWQIISRFNPILYMINGLRYGFLGTSDVNVFVSLVLIIIFCVIVYFVCLKLLKSGYRLKN